MTTQPALFDLGEPAPSEPWAVVLPTEEERERIRQERAGAHAVAMLERFFAGGVKLVNVTEKGAEK